MKIYRYFLAIAALLASFTSFSQDDCDIDVSVAGISEGDVVPEAINRKLEAKLRQTLSRAGMVDAGYDSRFFVAGRFDEAYNDVTGGPSSKTYIKTTLTLYVGDCDTQKVYASEAFELSGAGSTDQMAYTRALNGLNSNNTKLVDFLLNAKQRIIDYYDANYPSVIDKAKKEMAARNYGGALFLTTSIPSCSKGYAAANALTATIYSQSKDYEGQQLLAKAKAAWAANPTAAGAAEAHSYLTQIDPAAGCASEASALSKEISKTTQKQWEFENITKYKDQVALEKHRITAAKEAAVAWAKSRPKQVNRYVFISPRYRYY